MLPEPTGSADQPVVLSATGAVTFESCTFGEGTPYSLEVSGVTLLHHCTVAPLWGGLPTPYVMGGLRVAGGVCCVADSTLHGTPAHFGSTSLLYAGSPGLTVQAGAVYVSSTSLRGGP